MTTTAAASDMGIGLGLALTLVAVVAAIVVGGAGFAGTLEAGDGGGLQVIAGLAVAVSLVAGSVAIVAMHAFAE
ncbi:MAG: hypothetical protein V5A43_08605 [Haloarculaceae archaeon]